MNLKRLNYTLVVPRSLMIMLLMVVVVVSCHPAIALHLAVEAGIDEDTVASTAR